MDLLPSVDLLRDFLLAHDRAVQEIIKLDRYIEQLSEQTFLASMGQRMTPAYKQMIRISVAEGMKRMYKEYRLQKWLKITEMAATVRNVLDAEVPPAMAMAHQGQVMQGHPGLPWQPAYQQTVQPVTSGQRVLSPIPGPLPPIISPINTPGQTTIRHPVTGATPEEFHQYTMANISGSSEQFTGRQLFQDETTSVVPYSARNNCGHTVPDSDIILIDSDHEDTMSELVPYSAAPHITAQPFPSASAQSHPGFSAQPFPGSSYIPQDASNNMYNQSVFPMVPHQMENDNIMDNDMMEWSDDDDDGSDYDDSEDSLAGVLFATEHLLPDEQQVRLDVEMGDMGVGHMVFDRVSATWYIQHCEYYRAS